VYLCCIWIYIFLKENGRILRTHDDTVTLPWTEQNRARMKHGTQPAGCLRRCHAALCACTCTCGRTRRRTSRSAQSCAGPRVGRSWQQRCELRRMAGFLGDGEVAGARGMLTEAFQGQRSVGSGCLPEQALHVKGS
jgi:hypothetical protein